MEKGEYFPASTSAPFNLFLKQRISGLYRGFLLASLVQTAGISFPRFRLRCDEHMVSVLGNGRKKARNLP